MESRARARERERENLRERERERNSEGESRKVEKRERGRGEENGGERNYPPPNAHAHACGEEEGIDNMLFMHEITWLLMQFKALIIPNICMLSYFKYILIILYYFML